MKHYKVTLTHKDTGEAFTGFYRARTEANAVLECSRHIRSDHGVTGTFHSRIREVTGADTHWFKENGSLLIRK